MMIESQTMMKSPHMMMKGSVVEQVQQYFNDVVWAGKKLKLCIYCLKELTSISVSCNMRKGGYYVQCLPFLYCRLGPQQNKERIC